MSTLSLKGEVIVINETQEFNKGFKKKTFVIKTEGEYPQSVIFEAIKDKIEMVESLKKGENVEVFFNVRGNEYKGKYYNNLQAWKIEIIQGETQLSIDNSVNENLVEHSEGDDDLPF